MLRLIFSFEQSSFDYEKKFNIPKYNLQFLFASSIQNIGTSDGPLAEL